MRESKPLDGSPAEERCAERGGSALESIPPESTWKCKVRGADGVMRPCTFQEGLEEIARQVMAKRAARRGEVK